MQMLYYTFCVLGLIVLSEELPGKLSCVVSLWLQPKSFVLIDESENNNQVLLLCLK